MTSAIQLNGISKRFGKTIALDDVSFIVPQGVVCAVLGANGAGKTTAIRILLGLEAPDAGTAEVLGMSSTKQSLDICRRVGYVAEKPPLYEWMRVGEIGWFAAGFYPPGYQATYSAYIAKFGLDPKQKIKTLSKGMRSKVALSLALAHTPDVLILDEPTSGLDPLVRREFLESMADVAASGRTVLLSSHQVNEVERVADMVAILLGGKLIAFESLDDLKRGIREVVATLPAVDTPPPEMPGQVLAHAKFGCDHQWMVRELNEERLRAALGTNISFSVRYPSLEDILLVMLRESRVSPVPSPPQMANLSGMNAPSGGEG
jgi:ABC-2 type transport system ATP-binding protein